jgi:hypothetical protein
MQVKKSYIKVAKSPMVLYPHRPIFMKHQLKVSKHNQIFLFSFEPKNERNNFLISALKVSKSQKHFFVKLIAQKTNEIFDKILP